MAMSDSATPFQHDHEYEETRTPKGRIWREMKLLSARWRGVDWSPLTDRTPSTGGGAMVLWLLLIGLLYLFVGFFLKSQIDETEMSPFMFIAQQNLLGKRPNQDANFELNVQKAYDEWILMQEKFPDKFSNFSHFLLEQNKKESNLRQKLKRLSKKSMALVNEMVVPPAPPQPRYSEDEEYELTWTYLSKEKAWPYVGSDRYLDQFEEGSRMYMNSLAVFPHSNRTRLHGLVGIWPNGTRAWRPIPMPPPIAEYPGGKDAALIDGGFYLNLSNALPLDRDPPDTREAFCKTQRYDFAELEDATVIITHYNEHPSTLLRSIHSVLNHTPPPLLREIILVDDHSNNTANLPGGFIYEYVKLLPKVKLMRLPERRGLVQARLAGGKIAKAPIIVVLDSHIEVNKGWLEPQLKRLAESPKSVVFPMILSLDSETLQWSSESGIGCFLSFKWMMQERPYFGANPGPDPIPSPSMAGGLFAVRRDWFFESGGYDEEFLFWGAENVEMGFRIWMCGGRVECTPCSRTYHIYRHGGAGYKSPGEYVKRNRLRTARLWMDEHWQIARHFNNGTDEEMGDFKKMLELKERLQCKNFQWFLDNVDPNREGKNLDDFYLISDLRNLGGSADQCIDNLSKRTAGHAFALFGCHGMNGSQGWFSYKTSRRIRNMSSESTCLGHDLTISYCDRDGGDDRWKFIDDKKWIAWLKEGNDDFESRNWDHWECLSADYSEKPKLKLVPCGDDENMDMKWGWRVFERDPNFVPLARN